jgi:hypothetical protein
MTTSPTVPYSMPEPEPYFDPMARPSHYSTDSYTSIHSSSSSGPRKSATSSAATSGRRLPITPGQTPGAAAYNRPPLPGLPSDLRPSGSPHALPSYPSSSSVNAAYHPEKVPNTENGGYSSGYSQTTSRTSHDPDPQSPKVNVYDVDERRTVNNGHHYSQSHSHSIAPQQYSHASSQSLGVSHSLHKSQSGEYMMPQPDLTASKPDSLSPCELLYLLPLLVVDLRM